MHDDKIRHNEIEDLKNLRSFSDLEEISGSSVEISGRSGISSMIGTIGAPYSMECPFMGSRTRERCYHLLFTEMKLND